VAELVEVCGRLPLAIRIAAARLRSHPAWDLLHLVQRLRDQQHRLGELEAGQRSVTATLDVSYQHLSADLQRTYRLLGLHPGPDIEVYATAALLDSTVIHAARQLDQLLDANLLSEPAAGRYRFHDLVRAHATHTAARDQTQPTSRTALNRILDHYRHTAALAVDAAYPYERDRRPEIPPPGTPTPDLPDAAAALDWLDNELTNLLATARHTAEHSQPEHVLHLSSILQRHLRTSGHYQDAETLHRQALATARATGHRPGELDALNSLGHIHRLQSRYTQAADHYQRALHIAQAVGDRAGELDALNGLGQIHWMQGRHAQATDHYQQALRIARATGHRVGELNALTGLGFIHRLQGRHAEATDHFQQLLDLARATGIRNFEFEARQGLGRLRHTTGDPQTAVAHHDQALALADELGQPVDQARAHDGLAHAHHALNQHEQARKHWHHALNILTDIGVDYTDDEEATPAATRTHLALTERAS
jgi:tetratricopeptide (TPR) repeat protein